MSPSLTCEVTKLHTSILYLITVIVNHLNDTLLQKNSTIQDPAQHEQCHTIVNVTKNTLHTNF